MELSDDIPTPSSSRSSSGVSTSQPSPQPSPSTSFASKSSDKPTNVGGEGPGDEESNVRIISVIDESSPDSGVDYVSLKKLEKLQQELELENQDKIQAASLGLCLLSENVSLRERCEQLESDLNAAEEANNRLRSELRSMDESFCEEEAYNSTREEDLSAQIQSLRTRYNHASKEVERVTNEKDYLFARNEELRDQMALLNNQLKTNRSNLKSANAKKQRLLRDKTILQRNVTELRNKVLKLKTAKAELDSLKRQVKRLSRENAALLRATTTTASSSGYKSYKTAAAGGDENDDNNTNFLHHPHPHHFNNLVEPILSVMPSSTSSTSNNYPNVFPSTSQASKALNLRSSPYSSSLMLSSSSRGEKSKSSNCCLASSSSSSNHHQQQQIRDSACSSSVCYYRDRELLEDLKREISGLKEEKEEREAREHWLRSRNLATELGDAAEIVEDYIVENSVVLEWTRTGEDDVFTMEGMWIFLYPFRILWSFLTSMAKFILSPPVTECTRMIIQDGYGYSTPSPPPVNNAPLEVVPVGVDPLDESQFFNYYYHNYHHQHQPSSLSNNNKNTSSSSSSSSSNPSMTTRGGLLYKEKTT